MGSLMTAVVAEGFPHSAVPNMLLATLWASQVSGAGAGSRFTGNWFEFQCAWEEEGEECLNGIWKHALPACSKPFQI